MSTATSGSDGVKTRTQQPMLASQREAAVKPQNVGRFAQYFPLGYKEAFNQWVSCVAF